MIPRKVAGTGAETGKRVGWRLVGPEDKWHLEAFAPFSVPLPDGTYELIGPKVRGNPERIPAHWLCAHDQTPIHKDAPRSFSALREWLIGKDIEGIVWHHPDGRMAKIKLRDLGLRRGEKMAEQ